MKSIVKMLAIIGFVSFSLAGSSKQHASKSDERQSENVESDEIESWEVDAMRDALRESMHIEDPYFRIINVLETFCKKMGYDFYGSFSAERTIQEILDWGQKQFKLLMRIQSEEEFHSELDFQKQQICDRVGQYYHSLLQDYSEFSKQCAKTKELCERKEKILLGVFPALRDRFEQEFSEWTMKEQDACIVRLKMPILLAENFARYVQNAEDHLKLKYPEYFEEESEKEHVESDKHEGVRATAVSPLIAKQIEIKELEAMRSALRKCKHIQSPNQRIFAVYGTYHESLGVTEPEGQTLPEINDWFEKLAKKLLRVQSEEEFHSKLDYQKSLICDRLLQKQNDLSQEFSQFFKQCTKPGFQPDIRQAMRLNMRSAEFRQDYEKSIFEWTVKEQDACSVRLQRPLFFAKTQSLAQGLQERYNREKESKKDDTEDSE